MIADQIKVLNRLRNYAIVAVRLSIIERSELIEELNRQQLSRGERSDNSILPNYSPFSVELGKPSGPIQLFDEGDFYEGINANIFDDEIRIEGEDEKTAMLISKYGQMILGLTEENKQILIEAIRPLVIQKMRAFYSTI